MVDTDLFKIIKHVQIFNKVLPTIGPLLGTGMETTRDVVKQGWESYLHMASTSASLIKEKLEITDFSSLFFPLLIAML
jgi:hypothetical protein